VQRVDGVMVGRAAYHDPYLLAELDATLFSHQSIVTRHDVVDRMRHYAAREIEHGTPLRAVTRHMLGLYHGRPNARKWRQMLSDATLLADNSADLILRARQHVERETLAAEERSLTYLADG